MDMTPLPDVELPARHPRLRKEIGLLVAMIVAVFLVAAITFHSRLHRSRPALSPANALAQQAALLNALAAAPATAPDPNAWDEDRDGDNALDIEDTNGQGTIFVDKPTKTRILCVSGSSCIVLPNPKPAPLTAFTGKIAPKS